MFVAAALLHVIAFTVADPVSAVFLSVRVRGTARKCRLVFGVLVSHDGSYILDEILVHGSIRSEYIFLPMQKARDEAIHCQYDLEQEPYTREPKSLVEETAERWARW